ncbi:MAG: hypothetical protein ABJE47_17330 [bacterium]
MQPCLVRAVHITHSRFAHSCALFLALFVSTRALSAQVRERPVPFDSAGRVSSITPPLAARLGLSAPLWPASGDYLDVRLYAVGDSAGTFVLVVRRTHDVLERFPFTAAQQRDLAAAVNRGDALAHGGAGADVSSSYTSEPVRGSFVVNQTLLGALLFGPAAAAMVDNGSGSTAAYLAVTGTTFFLAANMSKTSAISRAQNHLSWHSARRGAIAGELLAVTVSGDDPGGQYLATAALLGGITGDVLGFVLAEPMTDAEAHGTSHGSTITAGLATGLLGAGGALNDHAGGKQVTTALIVAAGVAGYPLGLQYVRNASYRIAAGDVGTLVTTEFLGMSAAAALLPERGASTNVVAGLLTAGFALGALSGDALLVQPFDHSESDARLLQYGTFAGALVASALPVLAQSTNPHVIFGAATVGGILGAVLTEQLIEPQRAGTGSGSVPTTKSSRVDVRFAPESLVLAGLGLKGNHSLVSLTF